MSARRRRRKATTEAPQGSTTEDPKPRLAPLQIIRRVRCGRCSGSKVGRWAQWRDPEDNMWVYYRCAVCVDPDTLKRFTFKVLVE